MEQYVRITNSKMIYLTSACAGVLDGRCDLYECGNVTALVSAPLGEYHLGRKSQQCKGMNLCSVELVSFLMNKYQIGVGGKLTAWVPVGSNKPSLFFATKVSDKEARQCFDERFEKVELSYRKRYGEWAFVEDRCISFTLGIRAALPPRMSLQGDGTRLALVRDPMGPFTLECQDSRKGECIMSTILARYCREQFGGGERSVLFHARTIQDGVCFTLREEDLLPEDNRRPLKTIELVTPPDNFLRIGANNDGIYCSVRAAHILGERIGVYQAGRWLALRGQSNGTFTIKGVGYQHNIWSKALMTAITQRYSDGRKIYLREHGPFLVLVPRAEVVDNLPPPGNFYRIDQEPGTGKRHRTTHGRLRLDIQAWEAG